MQTLALRRRGWATSRKAREVAHPQFLGISVQRQDPLCTFLADAAHPPPRYRAITAPGTASSTLASRRNFAASSGGVGLM